MVEERDYHDREQETSDDERFGPRNNMCKSEDYFFDF